MEAHFERPERVLQFGTGAFLRGFADFFVEQANRAGILKGRVVVVGSTGSGRARRLNEIVPSLNIDPDLARSFAQDVLERFANPFIRHDLLGITFQQTMKMRVRVVPSLVGYARKQGRAPSSLAFGLACFLLFQHPEVGPPVAARPPDDAAGGWCARRDGVDRTDAEQVHRFVAAVCADEALWGTRLDDIPAFVDDMAGHLVRAARKGVPAALDIHLQTIKA